MCTISNPSVLGKGWRESSRQRERIPAENAASRCCGLALESLGTEANATKGPAWPGHLGGQAHGATTASDT